MTPKLVYGSVAAVQSARKVHKEWPHIVAILKETLNNYLRYQGVVKNQLKMLIYHQ